MGHRCVVNGPDETRETDIGFTGCANGTHPVYINALIEHRLKKTVEIETAKRRESFSLAATQYLRRLREGPNN